MDKEPSPQEMIANIWENLRRYNATPEGMSQTLREDLAFLILKQLKERGWTQKQLAQECGKTESFISRLIHTDTNVTFEVAATVLHALDIQPRLVDARALPTTQSDSRESA